MGPMFRKARSANKRESAQPVACGTARYREVTREPLYCLVFLFPLVAAYELGAVFLRPQAWPEQRLVAQRLIQQLVAWFGTDAVWAPGAALLLTLLAWQVWSRKPWRLRGGVPLLMVAESLLLAAPLFVLARLLPQGTGPGGVGIAPEGLRVYLVLALGAAVYEELVFRFYLISGLRRLLTDVCHVPKGAARITAMALAAVAFGACHLKPIGAETFAWPLFLMLTAAGAYLAFVFVFRGLGVATGCHAAFNLISLLLDTS